MPRRDTLNTISNADMDAVVRLRRNSAFARQYLESVSKVSSLTGVILGNANIHDLTPLARLKSLTLLGLYGNQIRDLSPLAELTELESLSLMGNQVEDLTPLAGLKKLKYVEVIDNRIADFSPVERDGIEIVGRDRQAD